MNVNVIKALQQLQGSRTQRAFAREVAVSESTISRLYGGSRRLGLSVAQRIHARYPQFTPAILALAPLRHRLR